ncbi:MAG: hypothetical protein WKG07_32645 [Hymenobacter sp.]
MLQPTEILLGPEYTWPLLRALAEIRHSPAGQTRSTTIQRNPVYERYKRQLLLRPKTGATKAHYLPYRASTRCTTVTSDPATRKPSSFWHRTDWTSSSALHA